MGTTDRKYTFGELSDLVAAKDVELSNLANSFQNIQAAWAVTSPLDEASWSEAYDTVHADYFNGARAQAANDLSAAKSATYLWGDWSQGDATQDYHDVLLSLDPGWPAGWTPGSMNDLTARLSAAYTLLDQTPPSPAPLPQPQYDSGENPNSVNAYLTGAAYKLGLVQAASVPPGTPGGPGTSDPPLVPTWAKWLGGAAVGLFALDKIASITRGR